MSGIDRDVSETLEHWEVEDARMRDLSPRSAAVTPAG